MKRLAVVLLIPLLVFSLASCDGTIRAKLVDAMGKLDSNVWIESGAVKPSTAGVDGVTTVISSVTTDYTPATAVSDLGLNDLNITVTIPPEVTAVLKPQTAAEKQALEDSLSTALTSTTQTQQLVTTLSQPVTDTGTVAATQGSMKVAAAALQEVSNIANVPTEIKDTLASFATALNTAATSSELTQADVVTMQLVTNLVSTTAVAANAIASAGSVDISNPDVKAAIDDSLFVVNVAQQLSGVGSLDLTQMLNLSDLMAAFGSRSVVRAVEADRHELPITFDSEETVKYVNQIGKIVVAYVGATDEGRISEADYNRMIRSLNIARSAYDNAMSFAKKGGANSSNAPATLKDACGLTGMMDYAVAVGFTELDKFGADAVFTDLFSSGTTIRAILESILVNSPELLKGEMTTSSRLYIGKTYWDELQNHASDQDQLLAKLKDYAKKDSFKNAILNAYDTIATMSSISGNTLITDKLSRAQLEQWLADMAN
jgi:hypothetical protein